MPLKITPVAYRAAKIEDRAGGAARALESPAEARVNLEFVLARRMRAAKRVLVGLAKGVLDSSSRSSARSASSL